jgi:hypothetical protein
MSEVTLEAIEHLLDLKLEEKLESKLEPIKQTLENHTTLLDGIAKDVKLLKDEKIITTNRLDNLETWGQKVGKKVEIGLEL